MLQAVKKKTRKLTYHGKLLLGVLISNVIVFYDKERSMGNDRQSEKWEGGEGEWKM